jgi:hypothetical protein
VNQQRRIVRPNNAQQITAGIAARTNQYTSLRADTSLSFTLFPVDD